MAKIKFIFHQTSEHEVKVVISHTTDLDIELEQDLKPLFDIELLKAEITEGSGTRTITFITDKIDAVEEMKLAISQSFRKTAGLNNICLN